MFSRHSRVRAKQEEILAIVSRLEKEDRMRLGKSIVHVMFVKMILMAQTVGKFYIFSPLERINKFLQTS